MGTKQSKENNGIFIPEIHTGKGGTESIDEFSEFLKKSKKKICKIILSPTSYGTGFFCGIFTEDKKRMIVLFTCYHVLDLNYLNTHNAIKIEYIGKNIMLKLNNRKKFTNKDLDYTCIEIIEEDNIQEFFEVDENILKSDYSNDNMIDEGIIIIAIMRNKNQEPEESFDFGFIKSYNKKEQLFLSCYNSDSGSSGGAIILKTNHKIIAMHKGGYANNNSNQIIKRNLSVPMNLIFKDIKIVKCFQSNKSKPNFLSEEEINKNYTILMEEVDKLYDKICYVKCKECGKIRIEENGECRFKLQDLPLMEMIAPNGYLTNCSFCNKNNYQIVTPFDTDEFNLNFICKNCNEPISENDNKPNFRQQAFAWAYFKDRMKKCEKCGNKEYKPSIKKLI